MKKVNITTEKKIRSSINIGIQFLLFALVFTAEGCNNDKATKHFVMNSNFKDYFVNFEVGTKWIYEDTISHYMDTIELVSKNNEGWNSKDESAEGYRLVFEARKNRNFVLNSSITKNGNYAELHPEPLANGADDGTIAWAYNEIDNRWFDQFVESITFQGINFSNVVLSFSTTPYYSNCYFSKYGLLFFNEYVLIKTVKK